MSEVIALSRLRNVLPQIGAAVIGISWVGAKRLPPGHLHAHFGWVAATATWAAASVEHRSYSVYLHAFEIHDRRYVDRFTAIPLRRAKALFTHCSSDAYLVAERTGRRPLVARLALPAEWFAVDAGPRDPGLLVCVGRLVEKKGHRYLLDALSRCTTEWRCVIVGDGPLRQRLEAQVVDMGLSDRVSLIGERSEGDVRRLLRRAAVFALASVETADGDRDGSPVVIAEALACGAAVVASAVGGIEEMVGDGGIIVPPGDAAALAQALDVLAHNSAREWFAARGAARMKMDWRSEIVAHRVLQAIS